uniref:CPSF_A domain-containing protein n=1 Tax=Ascaris lumbricoides TaxID=6252 RepID=A0A0M3IE93_ASCLU
MTNCTARREVIRGTSYKLYSENENITSFGITGKYLGMLVKQKKSTRSTSESSVYLSFACFIADNVILVLSPLGPPHIRMNMLPADHSSTSFIFVRSNSNQKGCCFHRMKSNEEKMTMKRGARMRLPVSYPDVRSDTPYQFAGRNGGEENAVNCNLPIYQMYALMDILSPSLFSLHSKGKGIEALTSLPNLIKEVKNKDFDEWREFIIEASGVSDAIDPFIKADNLRHSDKFFCCCKHSHRYMNYATVLQIEVSASDFIQSLTLYLNQVHHKYKLNTSAHCPSHYQPQALRVGASLRKTVEPLQHIKRK